MFADLFRKTRALAELNETLETRVQERTAELAAVGGRAPRSERAEGSVPRDARARAPQPARAAAHRARSSRCTIEDRPPSIGPDARGDEPADRSHGAAHRRSARRLAHQPRKARARARSARARWASSSARSRSPRRCSSARGIRPSPSTAPEQVIAVVDPTRIAQIVANLLNNASKHSPLGADDPRRASAARRRRRAHRRRSTRARASPPISSSASSTCSRRSSGRRRRTSDGLGIGLALSRQLADAPRRHAHGGERRRGQGRAVHAERAARRARRRDVRGAETRAVRRSDVATALSRRHRRGQRGRAPR